MSKIKVYAWDILRMIPDEEIAKIAKDTKVDYCAKVLTGERLFYLLVFTFLSADHVGQRRLESISTSLRRLLNYCITVCLSTTRPNNMIYKKENELGFSIAKFNFSFRHVAL